jgi:hypothetical protein
MAIILNLILLIFSYSLIASEVSRPLSKSTSVFLDFLSWQQEGKIKSGNTKSPIILTNRAVCAGGSLGHNFLTYRSFVDGCFVYGLGNVGSEKKTITYDQSDISLYGLKASIGISKFVSPSNAEIGFKIPLLLTHQLLTEPKNTKLTTPTPFSVMASLYSRWPIQQWFVQTEFSKFVDNDLVLFSVGAGYNF